jgi:hypothetical protein
MAPDVPKKIEYKRAADFSSKYSNNVFLEGTSWDMKLLFGEVDLHEGANTVVQHTAITLPWPTIKILTYFLQLHLIAHEAENGRITIPKGVIPAIPKDAEGQAKLVLSLYENFVKANPETLLPREE